MAKTCENCGYAYNDNDAENCAICNSPLRTQTDTLAGVSADRLYNFDTEDLREPQFVNNAQLNSRMQINREQQTSPPPSQVSQIPLENNGVLEGRITHVDIRDERPLRDIFRFLSKMMIGILFLIPFLCLFLITSCLSLSFAILGFRDLSQFFNPLIWSTSIFELLEVIVLRRLHGTDTIPIYRGMIEDNNSQEAAFFFRGPIRMGNFITGHNVRLSGHSARGTFFVSNGLDLTSNSEIVSDYRNPWRVIFFIMITVYIFIGITIYLNLSKIGGFIG